MVFESNDEDFPRGGGGILTPLEVKQAQQVSNLNESNVKKRRERNDVKDKNKLGIKKRKGTSSIFDDNDAIIPKSFVTQNSPTVRILSKKDFNVGSKVWGVISAIKKDGIVIHLPNDLYGFVPLDQTSDVISEVMESNSAIKEARKRRNKKLNEEGAAMDQSLTLEEEEEMDNDEFTELDELFYVGQLVSCTVTKIDSDAVDKGKKYKKIQLSLSLSLLHKSFTLDSFYVGMPIHACIASVEDHGYLLTFGVSKVSGFLLEKDHLNEDDSPAIPYKKGQIISCIVSSINRKIKTINVKTNSNLTNTTPICEFEGMTIEHLLPSQIIDAEIKSVKEDGLILSFLKYFSGSVDRFHLGIDFPPSDLKTIFSEKAKVSARILFVDILSKKIYLTLNPYLLSGIPSTPSPTVTVGEIFENAKVFRIDKFLGIVLEINKENGSYPAYVFEMPNSEEKNKNLKVGDIIKTRIMGFRSMENIFKASIKKSILEKPALSGRDLEVGLILNGRVRSIESYGALLNLAGDLRALCTTFHYSESQLTKTPSYFKVDSTLKFRVLKCERQRGRISVTHKKGLVESKLPIITKPEDAVLGLITHGFIISIKSYGIFVEFYNAIQGFVKRHDMGIDSTTNPEEAFRIGQVIKCRIIGLPVGRNRIPVSFVLQEILVEEREIKVGSIVSGKVKSVFESALTIEIVNGRKKLLGRMDFIHLSDFESHVDSLKKLIKPGYEFKRLIVIGKHKKNFTLSAKHSLLSSSSSSPSIPSSFEEVELNQVYQGYVSHSSDFGCFVYFLNSLYGMAHISEFSDSFISDTKNYFYDGQSVRAKVINIDEENKKYKLSLKLSTCHSTDAELLKGFFYDEEEMAKLQSKNESNENNAEMKNELNWHKQFQIGEMVDVEIQEVNDYGVIVNFEKNNDVVGFVTRYHAGDNVEIGKKMKGRVLDIGLIDGVIDITLRKELMASEKMKDNKNKATNTVHFDKDIKLLSKFETVIQLVKEDYMVLSFSFNNIIYFGFASTKDYNFRKIDPHKLYVPGKKISADLHAFPTEETFFRILFLIDHRLSHSLLSDSPADSFSKLVQKNAFSNAENVQIGSIVQAEIISIQALNLDVSFGDNIRGRIHSSEISNSPVLRKITTSQYSLGQKVNARVLKVNCEYYSNSNSKKVTHSFAELSIRQAENGSIDVPKGKKNKSVPYSVNEVKVNEIVIAHVEEVKRESLWLSLSPTLKGKLFVLQSSSDINELSKFRKRFSVGQALRCKVLSYDKSQNSLKFTLLGVDQKGQISQPDKENGHDEVNDKNEKDNDRDMNTETKKDEQTVVSEQENESQLESNDAKSAEHSVGDIVTCIVIKIIDMCLSVRLDRNEYGQIFLTEVFDQWVDSPLEEFKVGMFLKCAVIGQLDMKNKKKVLYDLSLRRSKGGDAGKISVQESADVDKEGDSFHAYSIDELKPNMIIHGYVKSCSAKGCFVYISRSIIARVQLKDLANGFLTNPEQLFPPGKLVKGRITEVDHAMNWVSMTLKNVENDKNSSEIENFKVGKIINGVVRNIETFGIFITIENTDLVGLCHKSEIYDGLSRNVENKFQIGEKVRAKILQIDDENSKFKLSMRNSIMDEEENDGNEEGDDEDNELEDKEGEDEQGEEEEDSENESDEEIEGEEEAMEGKEEEKETRNEMTKHNEEKEEEDDTVNIFLKRKRIEEKEEKKKKEKKKEVESERENEKEKEKVKKKMKIPPLAISLDDVSVANKDEDEQKMMKSLMGEEEEEEDMDEDHLNSSKKLLKKRMKKKELKIREKSIMEAEEKRMKGSLLPESSDDYERLLLSSPNSSFVWIKFIAHLLSLTEIDKARAVAERALNTINYREEGEKMNIWIAYLNLENMYGNPPKESVLKLFQRACQLCDVKKLHVALLGIYERTDQSEMAENLLKKMVKKFSTSAKVWLRYVQNLLKRNLTNEAKTILDTSLTNLPKHKHIKVLTQTALLEYRFGFPELARMVFEIVLRNFPKRIDLWGVYIDQEIKVGNQDAIRNLFDRAVSLNLPTKKMKFFFKKYLEYEQAHGDEKSVETVKAKAIDFVESRLA